ncbi:hypothetical protein PVAG01_07544 [Phlyctema vagabunda]|uniref:Uncharacterized protein n=1 Tax=Phlyctema vagabunda TaxID=108571 RepID=A0ABR4PCQ8_9HELO
MMRDGLPPIRTGIDIRTLPKWDTDDRKPRPHTASFARAHPYSRDNYQYATGHDDAARERNQRVADPAWDSPHTIPLEEICVPRQQIAPAPPPQPAYAPPPAPALAPPPAPGPAPARAPAPAPAPAAPHPPAPVPEPVPDPVLPNPPSGPQNRSHIERILQQQLETQNEQLVKQNEQLDKQNEQLDKQNEQLDKQNKQLETQNELLVKQKEQLDALIKQTMATGDKSTLGVKKRPPPEYSDSEEQGGRGKKNKGGDTAPNTTG